MAMTPDGPAPAPTVERVDAEGKYVILVRGARVGFTHYVDRGEQRIFVHTEIDDEHTGHGLAGTLIAFALSDTRGQGRRIVALCPFVSAFLREHHEWDDIVDRPTPALIARIRNP